MTTKQITKTSAGLRDILFEELSDLRAGNVDDKHANATARIAENILGTVRVELEHAVLTETNQATAINLATAPVKLGIE